MAGQAVLGVVDYVLLAVIPIVSATVGIYFAFSGGRQSTTSEVLLGDRKLHVLPVSMSMFMSFYSAIYILGNTAEVYKYGIQRYGGLLGAAVGYLLATLLFVPFFYQLKITTIFEVSLLLATCDFLWLDKQHSLLFNKNMSFLFQYLYKRFNSKVLHIIMVIVQLCFQVRSKVRILAIPFSSM